MHQIALVVNGVHLLENLKLDELAAKNVYEFAFIMQPLKLQGATGSTVAADRGAVMYEFVTSLQILERGDAPEFRRRYLRQCAMDFSSDIPGLEHFPDGWKPVFRRKCDQLDNPAFSFVIGCQPTRVYARVHRIRCGRHQAAVGSNRRGRACTIQMIFVTIATARQRRRGHRNGRRCIGRTRASVNGASAMPRRSPAPSSGASTGTESAAASLKPR